MQIIEKWKGDYDYRTVTSAIFSLFVTVFFAVYNGIIGACYSSIWHGSICVYYLVLSVLRGLVIAAERRSAVSENSKNSEASVPGSSDLRSRVLIIASALLLLLNLCLIVPIRLMVVMQKPVSLTLIPAIAMAAYTTYRIIIASVNLKKRKTSGNVLVRLLRVISFIDALVSVLTLQNTLIMVNSGDDMSSLLTLTAATSGAIWLAIVVLSVSALVRSIRMRRENIE